MLCHPGVFLGEREDVFGFPLIIVCYDGRWDIAGKGFQARRPENRQELSLVFANMGNSFP